MREHKKCRIDRIEDDDTCWDVHTDDSGIFCLNKSYGVEPRVGDEVEVEIVQGSSIVGVSLNGKTVFSMTDQEIEDEHKAYCENLERQKKADFEKDRETMDRDFESLPDIFRKRIQRFRGQNPDFRWDYEPYELFCCKQAILIATALKTQDEIRKFQELTFDAQKELVAGLDEGHSGNTFGCSVMLAYFYVGDDKDLVWKCHGALCPLVGCERYGHHLD
jgi:hypothetical protein